MIGPILVAIEEEAYRRHFVDVLTRLNFRIIEAESGLRSIQALSQRKQIALAFIDSSMSDLGGKILISQARSLNISTPIVVISRDSDETALMEMLSAGASDFISIDAPAIRIAVTTATILQKNALQRELDFVRNDTDCQVTFDDYVKKSSAMRKMLQRAQAAAHSAKAVFICGEPATGRETIARTIHRESAFCGGPFVRVQCEANYDEREFETRWIQQLRKKMLAAVGGSLCLYNFDRLTTRLQKAVVELLGEYDQENAPLAKFLSNLTELNAENDLCSLFNEVRREDSGLPVLSDAKAVALRSGIAFRLMAVSNLPFSELEASGTFLPSLLKEFKGEFINVPPLRQRREDLPEIAHKIVETIIVETGATNVVGLSGVASALLSQYQWPGNLSELYQTLFRAVLLSEGPVLGAQDLAQLTSSAPKNEQGIDVESPVESDSDIRAYFTEDAHIKPMQQIEKEAIELAIKRYNNRISEISRRLKIGRSTLYRKLEAYSLTS